MDDVSIFTHLSGWISGALGSSLLNLFCVKEATVFPCFDRVIIVVVEGHLVDHVMRQSLRCGVDWLSRVSSVGADFTDGGRIEYQALEEIQIDDQTIRNC